MVSKEDFEAGALLKEQGNVAFKAGDLKLALKNYSRVFGMIGMNGDLPMELMGMGGDVTNKGSKEVKGEASALRIKTFQNIMIIYHKWGNVEKVKEKADKILELAANLEAEDPLNKQKAKAFFFRARAHRLQTNFELAEKDLNSAKEIIDDERMLKEIEREFKLLEKSIDKEEKRFERKMRKAMKKNQKKELAASKKASSESTKKVAKPISEAMEIDEQHADEEVQVKDVKQNEAPQTNSGDDQKTVVQDEVSGSTEI